MKISFTQKPMLPKRLLKIVTVSIVAILSLQIAVAAEPGANESVPKHSGNTGAFHIDSTADFNFNSTTGFCAHAVSGYFRDDDNSICVTPAYVLEGTDLDGHAVLKISPVFETEQQSGGRAYRFEMTLLINPAGIKAQMADELRDAAKDALPDSRLQKYKQISEGQLVDPCLLNFTVEQVVDPGEVEDFAVVSEPEVFNPGPVQIHSRLFTTKEEADGIRNKYLNDAPLTFRVLARMFATQEDSKSSVDLQMGSIEQTKTFQDLKGAAPALTVKNTDGSFEVNDSNIALTRHQKQDFTASLTQEFIETYHIQNPEDVTYLQSEVNAAVEKLLKPTPVTENFGQSLKEIHQYGFSTQDVSPDEIDKLVTDARDFLSNKSNSSFSGNANASFLGLSGGAGMSQTELKDQMSDKGWDFSSTGNIYIPKSLDIFILNTNNIATFGKVKIQIIREHQSSTTLNVSVPSNSLFVDDSTLSHVGGYVPPGTIVSYGGAKPPSGWLICDGSALRSSDPAFKALYEAIRTNWGNGTSQGPGAIFPAVAKGIKATDFNVPDLRGYFLRGVDGGAGRDPDIGIRTKLLEGGNEMGSVGSYQPDQFKAHSHALGLFEVERDSGHGERVPYPVNPGGRNEYTSKPAGGNETRPENAYVTYIVKY